MDSALVRQKPRLVLIVAPWIRILCFDGQIITFVSITLLLYLRIIYKLRKGNVNTTISSNITQKTRSTTNMMAIVLITMVICWFPWNIWASVANMKKLNESLSARLLHEFTLILIYSNSFINPFIYAKMNQDFRNAYKKLFSLKWRWSTLSNGQVAPENIPNNQQVQQVA